MDAFAVAVSQGAANRADGAAALRIAVAFGVAQAVMPLIGWSLGALFVAVISSVDHWIALALLGYLGLRMIKEGLGRDEADKAASLGGWALLAASLATSVDAAVAGVTLPMFGVPVLLACVAIGVTTAVLSYAGVYFGAAVGARLGKTAEVAGGIILIGLGARIFIEHQFFG